MHIYARVPAKANDNRVKNLQLIAQTYSEEKLLASLEEVVRLGGIARLYVDNESSSTIMLDFSGECSEEF